MSQNSFVIEIHSTAWFCISIQSLNQQATEIEKKEGGEKIRKKKNTSKVRAKPVQLT